MSFKPENLSSPESEESPGEEQDTEETSKETSGDSENPDLTDIDASSEERYSSSNGKGTEQILKNLGESVGPDIREKIQERERDEKKESSDENQE